MSIYSPFRWKFMNNFKQPNDEISNKLEDANSKSGGPVTYRLYFKKIIDLV